MQQKQKKQSLFASRGFNMFSAIVSMILIMTGVVLTSNLITTEERTSNQIYSMLNNYRLADAANLARADSLQTFNYNFREKLEEYLSYSPTRLRDERGLTLFSIRTTGNNFDFDTLKKSFETSILLMDQNDGKEFDATLQFVADKTIDQFSGGTYGRYVVMLSDRTRKAKESVKNVTKAAIQAQLNAAIPGSSQTGFLEVVSCSDAGCPVGTFYFNIPLNDVNDEVYESLPRIIVKDLVTNEEIKMAILPRTNLKVYIPLRFFKAMYEAKKTAEAVSTAHTTIANYKLGICGGCKPNENPANVVTGNWSTDSCPAAQGVLVPLAANVLAITKYDTGGRYAGQKGLQAFGVTAVCTQASGAFTMNDTTFSLYNDTLVTGIDGAVPVNGCKLNELNIVTGTERTAVVEGTDSGAILYCGRVGAVYASIAYKETNPSYLVKGIFEPGQSDVYKIRIADESFVPIPLDSTVVTTQVCVSGVSPKECNMR